MIVEKNRYGSILMNLRRRLITGLLVVVPFTVLSTARAEFVRVTATVSTDVDVPVFTYFFLRSRLNTDGTEYLMSSSSLNGPMITGGSGPVIVETFVEDLPPTSYYKQYALFVGAYGGTYDPPDAASALPIVPPVTPHTGLITSLLGPPPEGSTFASVWGANESEVVTAYQTYLYNTPAQDAPIEEWQAYWQAIAPFTNMIFADPSRLIEWTPGPDGSFSISGPIYQFSDPVEIGRIEGQFTSQFANAVPEPSSLVIAMTFFGSLGLVAIRRRRQRQPHAT